MPVEDPPPSDMLPGKKKYIPPYTPNRTKSYTPTVPTPHRTSTASSNYKPRSVPSSSGASSSKMSSQINRPIASASIQQHSQLKNIKKFSKPMTEEEELEVESNKFFNYHVMSLALSSLLFSNSSGCFAKEGIFKAEG